MGDQQSNCDTEEKDKKRPVKNGIDLQKLKLEKLFRNIEKPVHVPERPKPASFSKPPEFVRNVMGSSAGAGSGEFHVYRHIRRRENARQKFIAGQADKEDKDAEYKRKLEENQRSAEQRTAKKRAKRLKQKARQKEARKGKRAKTTPSTDCSQGSESEAESDSGPESDAEAAGRDGAEAAGCDAEAAGRGGAETAGCDAEAAGRGEAAATVAVAEAGVAATVAVAEAGVAATVAVAEAGVSPAAADPDGAVSAAATTAAEAAPTELCATASPESGAR